MRISLSWAVLLSFISLLCNIANAAPLPTTMVVVHIAPTAVAAIADDHQHQLMTTADLEKRQGTYTTSGSNSNQGSTNSGTSGSNSNQGSTNSGTTSTSSSNNAANIGNALGGALSGGSKAVGNILTGVGVLLSSIIKAVTGSPKSVSGLGDLSGLLSGGSSLLDFGLDLFSGLLGSGGVSLLGSLTGLLGDGGGILGSLLDLLDGGGLAAANA